MKGFWEIVIDSCNFLQTRVCTYKTITIISEFSAYSSMSGKIENGNGGYVKEITTDEKANTSRKPPIGLQRSEKILDPELGLSWPLNNKCVLVQCK